MSDSRFDVMSTREESQFSYGDLSTFYLHSWRRSSTAFSYFSFASEIKALPKTSCIIIIVHSLLLQCYAPFMPSTGPSRCQLCNEIKANRIKPGYILPIPLSPLSAGEWQALPGGKKEKIGRDTPRAAARCFIC